MTVMKYVLVEQVVDSHRNLQTFARQKLLSYENVAQKDLVIIKFIQADHIPVLRSGRKHKVPDEYPL
jgi:hypothetical protein